MYVTAGAAGRSLYSFNAPLSYEGHENEVDSVASFINTKERQAERDRHLVAGALPRLLLPARGRRTRGQGSTATLTVRGIAETGEQVDHFTVAPIRAASYAPLRSHRSSWRLYMRLRTACLASGELLVRQHARPVQLAQLAQSAQQGVVVVLAGRGRSGGGGLGGVRRHVGVGAAGCGSRACTAAATRAISGSFLKPHSSTALGSYLGGAFVGAFRTVKRR